MIQDIIEDPEFVNQEKFDYEKFVAKVMETSSALSKLSIAEVSEKEDNFALNSKTYRVKKSPEKRKWKSMAKSKGSFYFEGDAIICHQFTLSVPTTGFYSFAIVSNYPNLNSV